MNSSNDAFVPATLVIAGLDPSGGAGLSLDVGIIRSLGMHALPIATGVAVQGSKELIRVVPADPGLIQEQLSVVEKEFAIGAVKIGMLGSQAIAHVLVDWLRERPRLPVVLDPVLRTSSGGNLGQEIMHVIAHDMLPLATVVTPNLDEAAALTGLTVTSREDMVSAAHALRQRGTRWALVTGGHLGKGEAADYLEGPGESMWLSKPRLPGGRHVRGTGCALSSVLSAGLAKGDPVPTAAGAAKDWVERGIASSFAAGHSRVLGFGE